MIKPLFVRLATFIALSLRAWGVGACTSAAEVYFSTDDSQSFYGRIWRANIDGSSATMIHRRASEFGIAEIEFNPGDGLIYWSEHYGGLWRSARDGSNPTRLLSSISSLDVHGIAFDGNFMYWSLGALSDGTGRGLWRANTSTLSPQSIFVNNNWSDDLSVNPTTKELYWTDPADCSPGCLGADWRSGAFGATKESVANLAGEIFIPHDIWVDAALGKLYWSGDGLHRSNLDGSNAETIVPGIVNAFAFSRSGDAVFYSVGNTLFRADRNGQNIAQLLVAEFTIEQITVDASTVVPEPSVLSLLAFGLFSLARCRGYRS